MEGAAGLIFVFKYVLYELKVESYIGFSLHFPYGRPFFAGMMSRAVQNLIPCLSQKPRYLGWSHVDIISVVGWLIILLILFLKISR